MNGTMTETHNPVGCDTTIDHTNSEILGSLHARSKLLEGFANKKGFPTKSLCQMVGMLCHALLPRSGHSTQWIGYLCMLSTCQCQNFSSIHWTFADYIPLESSWSIECNRQKIHPILSYLYETNCIRRQFYPILKSFLFLIPSTSSSCIFWSLYRNFYCYIIWKLLLRGLKWFPIGVNFMCQILAHLARSHLPKEKWDSIFQTKNPTV